ncbi:MAG: S8 family peptidase [Chloroflexi bacterium]|nr:S8 family peptidase [Chloroflexota bacterium]
MINAVAATVSPNQLNALATQPGIVSIVADYVVETAISSSLETEDNDRPDVVPTNDPMVYDFISPASIDVGANQLHDDHGLTGNGVTIAMLDSGVYFDHEIRDLLGKTLKKQFVGQVDFTDNNICVTEWGWEVSDGNYCWTGYNDSIDPFGHGSHVAGIIWNKFTDLDTSVNLGIAPNADILSVRILDENGTGSYSNVIEGIQFVVANKDNYNIRIINMSLSGYATTPYFVDPLNRAVEAAWAEGIVVLAAAGNSGPGAESITVPGNDPYIITVGAVNSKRTAGDWEDDELPFWSATGPTLDGFIKPDILAPGSNIVSFMYNDAGNINNSAHLVQQHPDYAETAILFRMNGTSMATAVASGVTALMLEAHPDLTPDEVKFRLMYTAQPALTENNELSYSPLHQGAGRIWAPDAITGEDIPFGNGNDGLDLTTDLAHGWYIVDEDNTPVLDKDNHYIVDETELAFHFQGPVGKSVSDDGQYYLYFLENPEDGTVVALGAAQVNNLNWIEETDLSELNITFSELSELGDSGYIWSGGSRFWGGGSRFWGGGSRFWGGGSRFWGGGSRFWGGGSRFWGGGSRFWGGGSRFWGGGSRFWGGGSRFWGGGSRFWGGNTDWLADSQFDTSTLTRTTWIENN